MCVQTHTRALSIQPCAYTYYTFPCVQSRCILFSTNIYTHIHYKNRETIGAAVKLNEKEAILLKLPIYLCHDTSLMLLIFEIIRNTPSSNEKYVISIDSHYLVNQIQTGRSGRSSIISEINKIKKRYNIIICYSNPDPENIKPMMALSNTACNLIFNAAIYKSTKNDF